jgi:hypothetical protein
LPLVAGADTSCGGFAAAAAAAGGWVQFINMSANALKAADSDDSTAAATPHQEQWSQHERNPGSVLSLVH